MRDLAVNRGDHLTLSLESWGRLGEAMAHHQGEEVFVFGGVPGERVMAEVLRVRRKYIAARVVQVLEPSEDRVEPPCPFYGACTGCQWQHVAYAAQLAAKHDLVRDALERVGGLKGVCVPPVIPAPHQLGYRNHARFTVGPGGALGFVHRETRRFVAVDHCLLMHQGVNDLLAQLQGKCGETTQLAVRAGEKTGDFLIQPRLKNPEITPTTGQKHYADSVNGRTFRVASPSFFQVNVEQAERLAREVRDALGLTGSEVLVDAYAGVGMLAILLAPYVREVLAIEESSAAVADARENASDLENVRFLLGKTEEVLARLEVKPDAVVLDPPRAGCQPEALQGLIRLGPPKVVYVSCDPETLARDLRLLCDGHYTLERVQPLDMFPQTHHVECVAVLTRADSRPRLTLASASPRRQELLSQLGLEFQTLPADIPEDPLPGEEAEEMVRRLSLEKARTVARRVGEGYVVGADSTVVMDGRSIGKPADVADARRMLNELRGTRHQVTTGLTVVHAPSGRYLTDSLISDVELRDYSEEEVEASIASGTPMDKAGAYAIQDPDFRPGRMTRGCYTNVIGLPLCRLLEMLEELGCKVSRGEVVPATAGCRTECPFQRGCGS